MLQARKAPRLFVVRPEHDLKPRQTRLPAWSERIRGFIYGRIRDQGRSGRRRFLLGERVNITAVARAMETVSAGQLSKLCSGRGAEGPGTKALEGFRRFAGYGSLADVWEKLDQFEPYPANAFPDKSAPAKGKQTG